MIIIGERVNSSRKRIKEAIEKRDPAFLIEEAHSQLAAGAKFIDINCAASLEKESEDLIWLITQIQQAQKCAISIDSPDPQAIRAACKIHNGSPFINSITAEQEKLRVLLPLIKETNSYAVALTMDEKGMPHDIEGRVTLAERIIERAVKEGVPADNIYVDPLTKPVSAEPEQPRYFLEALKRLKAKNIRTVGGLSNVSFGLPRSNLLNAVFLKYAIDSGIDAVIIDPTDSLVKLILSHRDLPEEQFGLARDVLFGEDAYSANYIKAFREGRL